MNIAIEHIAIPAANPAALKNWYERVLGAREIFNNGQTPPTLLITLPGGGWFEIYAAEKPLPDAATTSSRVSATSRCACPRLTLRGPSWKSRV